MNSVIRPVTVEDRDKVREIMLQEWGSELMIVHQDSFYPHLLPGFVAESNQEWTGLITYEIRGEECEILTLNSFTPRQGIGDVLINTIEETAQQLGCRSLMLVTTNDNLNALGFYQRRGFCIVSIEVGAVIEARKHKPEIPLIGRNSIPLGDEITLKKLLV